MRRLTSIAGIVLLAFLPVTALAQDQVAEVSASDLGVRYRTVQHPGHEGHKAISHDILLQNDLITYGIRYTACIDKAHAPRVAPLEGYIGMPRPCACNWYHSGFLEIVINGEDIGTYPLGDFSVLDSGGRGLCRLVWDYPAGQVRVSFVLDPSARYLKCQIRLRPKAHVKSISLRLRCYPSYFTAYHHRQGARRVRTPAALVREGENKTLTGEQNWWALYYDEVFDVARGEGEGPCGLLFVPRQVKTMRIAPGGYSVNTELQVKPTEGDIRLVFAEFPGTANADALKFMQRSASSILADLTATDFTPRLIANTDFDALGKELADLVARARPPADQAGKLRQLLADARGAAEAARGGDWKAELRVAKLLRAYRDALWGLKIQALFAQ